MPISAMPDEPYYIYDDGGRSAAGYKGDADDCVCRAIAIATDIPYGEIYRLINSYAGKACARTGVHPEIYRTLLSNLGWTWTPTMGIGTGCRVHLNRYELPRIGRIIARCSKHIVAVVDGMPHDTHDSSREGTRCVYGYWRNGA